jgi:hypothetical protein
MNQKEFDACWHTILTALSTGQHSKAKTDARLALRKLEAECRIDRSLLEVRTVIDHHVAEEKQTAPREHFEYAARRLRMWLEYVQTKPVLGLDITPGEREWLAAEIKRTDVVVTPLSVPMRRGRWAPKSSMTLVDAEVKRTTEECICPNTPPTPAEPAEPRCCQRCQHVLKADGLCRSFGCECNCIMVSPP